MGPPEFSFQPPGGGGADTTPEARSAARLEKASLEGSARKSVEERTAKRRFKRKQHTRVSWHDGDEELQCEEATLPPPPGPALLPSPFSLLSAPPPPGQAWPPAASAPHVDAPAGEAAPVGSLGTQGASAGPAGQGKEGEKQKKNRRKSTTVAVTRVGPLLVPRWPGCLLLPLAAVVLLWC